MGFLDNFEKSLERVVNGAFTKTFKSELQPVEISGHIRAEMDSKASILSRDRILAPNTYVVSLSTPDFTRMAALGDSLIEELTDLTTKHAKKQGFQFGAALSIKLVEDGSLNLGQVSVRSNTQNHEIEWMPSLDVAANFDRLELGFKGLGECAINHALQALFEVIQKAHSASLPLCKPERRLASSAQVPEFCDFIREIFLVSKRTHQGPMKGNKMKNIKRSAAIATGAAVALSLMASVPSFAVTTTDGSTTATPSTSTSATVARVETSLPVTITGIPAGTTKINQITRGAQFVAYKLAADATAIPATQPTTGGKPVKVEANISAEGVVSYSLDIHVAATASTTTKYAVYNAAGVGAFVTVVTDAAGTSATATTSAALTTAYTAPSTPALGAGKGVKGDRGERHGDRGPRGGKRH